MAERLAGINPDGYAAADTYEVLALIAGINAAAKRLYDVWHAVEWRDSCDWSEEKMLAVLAGYEQTRSDEEAS
jgi:hypothetical protein